MIKSGIGYGIKIWLITGLFSPAIFELQQLIRSFNYSGYIEGGLVKFELFILSAVTAFHLFFFLLPCVFCGFLLGKMISKNVAMSPAFSSLVFGFNVTAIGYGSMWLLLFSKVDYLKSENYWVEFLSMLGFQILLWLWVSKSMTRKQIVNGEEKLYPSSVKY